MAKFSISILAILLFIIVDAQSIETCGEQLIDYSRKNDFTKVREIIESGCDVNSKKEVSQHMYYCALRSGVHHPNSDIADLLLANGADPNLDLGRIMTPFHYSAGGSPTATFKILLEKGGNVNTLNLNSNYPTPIIWAISKERLENVKLLVENGAFVNPQESNGFTSPLHQAVSNKQFQISKYLLQQGANPNSKITEDYGDCIVCPIQISPIHSVGTFRDDSVAKVFVDLLLDYKADINIKNKLGQDVLTYMAPEGDYRIAEYLINKGVVISDTAIVRAASYQNTQFLNVLLQNGGNPNAAAYDGSNALDGAFSCCGDGFNENSIDRRLKTIELLLMKGAEPSQSLIDFVKGDRYRTISELFNKYGYK
jgi:ankyrin repeat protein